MSQSAPLSPIQLASYALPYAITYFLMAPFGVLHGIYAKYFGLSLGSIALVLFISRIFDAVTDPLIGNLSDHYHHRSGTRKPFLFVGAIIFLLGGYFLYVPSGEITITYFAVWSLVFYLGWTLFEIPHLAWGGEVSHSSDDKTVVFSFRSAAGYVGLLMFYCIPLLPFFPSTEITPQTLRWCFYVAAIVMPPCLYLCLKEVPSGHFIKLPRPLGPSTSSLEKARFLARLTIENKPFLIFLLVTTFLGIGAGIWNGLLFIYVDAFLGMGDQFAKVYIFAVVGGIFASLAWAKMAKWLGKKEAWLLGTAMVLGAVFYTGFLQPQRTSSYDLMMVKTLHSVGFACVIIMAPSMLSDIIDYGSWKFKCNRAATYFAINAFMFKTTMAVGASLGLAIAGWYGFDPGAESHSVLSEKGIVLAIAWVPSGFLLVALLLISLLPISARRYGIIHTRLQRLETRSNNETAHTLKADITIA